MTEDRLQNEVAKYLDRALPESAAWYAVPNGGRRKPREAAKLKHMGVKAGIPDIAIVHKGRAVFIELKTNEGKLSSVQVEMKARLTLAGAVVVVCHSVSEVTVFLNMAGIIEARASA